MYKKLISLAAAWALILSMTGCAESSRQETGTDGPGTSGTTTSAPASSSSTATTPDAGFEEIVLVDDENCLFKITGIDQNGALGYSLKASLENKTDKKLMFSLDAVSVNGVMCDPLWASEVSAGMKSKESISFSKSDFSAAGITDVTQIEFTLLVYNSEDWTADYLVDQTFTIYPMGEENATTQQRQPQESDIVLFDNDYATMIVTGFDPENIFGYTMQVYLVNKSDKNLMFTMDGVAVNGYMCDPFWAKTVAPGKCSYSAVSWSDSVLQENEITEIETLTLPIRVYDAKDLMGDYFVEETFSVKP